MLEQQLLSLHHQPLQFTMYNYDHSLFTSITWYSIVKSPVISTTNSACTHSKYIILHKLRSEKPVILSLSRKKNTRWVPNIFTSFMACISVYTARFFYV